MYNNEIHSYLFLLLFILAFNSSTLAIQASNHHLTPNQKPTSFRSLLQCAEGTYRIDSTCSRVCPSKFYGFQSQCWACSDSCENRLCLSDQECNPCKNGKVYLSGTKTCADHCPTGYFEDFHNKICVKCAEGCEACSYPNGLCSNLLSNLSNTHLIIYISVPLGLLILAVVGVICWRKTRKPKKKKKSRREREQPQQDQEVQSKKNKLAQLKKFTGNNGPVGPYNVMPEDFNQVDDNETEEAASPGGRSKKKRPSAIPTKEFKVDDSNDEHAITHGSIQFKRAGSLILSSRGGESPVIRARKPTKKLSRILRDNQSRQETLEAKPLDLGDESGVVQASYGEVPSPAHGLTPKRDVASFVLSLKKLETLESPKDGDGEKKEEIERVETVEEDVPEVEGIEEVEEMEEDDGEKRDGGYREDSSMNMSKDKDGIDLSSCTICGMNRKDCVNRPCGHTVGCYACMKLFRESYGVCPKCKIPIGRLERVKEKHVHKEVLHLEI